MNHITETQFASTVEGLLNLYHWHWIHLRPARVLRNGIEIYETPYSGMKGFMDYLAIRPPRIVVAEIKGFNGKLTDEQQEWFDLWTQCQLVENQWNVEVYLWRPGDFLEINKVLQ
jgi:hypothetical protein